MRAICSHSLGQAPLGPPVLLFRHSISVPTPAHIPCSLTETYSKCNLGPTRALAFHNTVLSSHRFPGVAPSPATSSGPHKPIGLLYWTLRPVTYTHTPAGDLGKQDSGIREGHGKLLVNCLLRLPDGSLGLADGSRFTTGHSHRKL